MHRTLRLWAATDTSPRKAPPKPKLVSKELKKAATL